ncbi:MAG: hypothetical protein K0R57_6504 [Paenibacillaceae bacterium]|jgi:hypothetical protein|nr:hypothetical protein [Paenibacillaceae bacterium]
MPLAEGVATPTLEQEAVPELYSEPCISHANVTKQSAIQDKIALFRSFFRGREDVYALYKSKREVQIYDYVDKEVPKLVRMYTKRRNGYMSMGYTEETLI